MDQRLLIVNADDFGLSDGVNRGIIAAHERGIVTAASLMVRGEAVQAAAEYAQRRPQLDIGLHIDLGEWRWVAGDWEVVYEVVPLGDGNAVENEIAGQVHQFRRLMGADPSHLDSHQHVHQRGAACAAAIAMARSLGVPLRHHAPGVAYCGAFYGQTTEGTSLPSHITADALVSLIEQLPVGVTELTCHPGFADDLHTAYRGERRVEVEALCDPRVRAALAAAGVVLTCFPELPRRLSNSVCAPRIR